MNGNADPVEANLQNQLQVAGLDPTLIVTVVQTILGLLSKCPNRTNTANTMQNPNLLAEVLLRRELQTELRQAGQSLSRSQLDQLTKTVLAVAREATPEQRAQLLDHVTQFQTI